MKRMYYLLIMLWFPVLIFCAGPPQACCMPYDDFSSLEIDTSRWWSREYVKKVEDGKLRLKMGNSSGGEWVPGIFINSLRLAAPESVHSVQAHVTLLEARRDNSPGSRSHARISGFFYNADVTGDGGDIWACVALGDRGNGGVEAYWEVFRSTAENPTSWPRLQSGTMILPGDVQYGTAYTLKLSFALTAEGQGVFFFQVNGLTGSYVGPVKRRDALSPYGKQLDVEIIAMNGVCDGLVHATFDDVYVNGSGTVYDDFSQPLSASEWIDVEFVREQADGRLEHMTHGEDARHRIDSYLTYDDPWMIETTVRVCSDSDVPDGGSGWAGVAGGFYNDTFGPGSGNAYNGQEGDVFAWVCLNMNDSGMASASVWVSRSNDESFSSATGLFHRIFPMQIYPDTDYDVSIRFEKDQLIFQCDEEQILYDIQTPKHAPNIPFREVRTQLMLASDVSGTLKASFDSVRVSGDPVSFCLQDYDNDTDMDGKDTAAYLSHAKGVVLADFAMHFGRTDCP